jgi:anti-sigma B factor antagonist
MKIKDDFKDGVAIIGLEGKVLGGDDATMFHGKVHEYVNNGFRKVVVDLAKVEWMNSVGMGMLISALTTLKSNEGQLRIANATGRIHSLLTITQLVRIFETYDSVDEAMKSF